MKNSFPRRPAPVTILPVNSSACNQRMNEMIIEPGLPYEFFICCATVDYRVWSRLDAFDDPTSGYVCNESGSPLNFCGGEIGSVRTRL